MNDLKPIDVYLIASMVLFSTDSYITGSILLIPVISTILLYILE